jgi:hypothetical protein
VRVFGHENGIGKLERERSTMAVERGKRDITRSIGACMEDQ